jgi:CheY-like chemotaxis protein
VRSTSCRSRTFASPDEFLARADDERIACLLLDIQLPGMDGFELRDRAVERGRETPVIFITAHPDGRSRERARVANAVAYLEKPFDDETGDEHGMAVCHNNLGNVYYATERYDEALQHLLRALDLYTETDDERLAASTLNNIGLLYHDVERFDDAQQSLERALSIEERINDQPGIALSLNNLGMVYDAWDKHREALDHYQRSLRVREEIGDRPGAGWRSCRPGSRSSARTARSRSS